MKDDGFAELFAGRAAAVRRTAYLLCGDWHHAEDLAQTAFAKVYVAWPRIRDHGAAEGYLRKTLLRTYLDDAKRGRHRERTTSEFPDLITLADDPDDRLTLLAALANVPPRQRACVVLRFYDDMSTEDTAELLGCSTGTVKSNTARGLAALRRVLGDDISEFALAKGTWS